MSSHPLGEYFERGLDDSHGIVAVNPDGRSGWYFATGKGRLYKLQTPVDAPARLEDLGWFHPAGPRYTAALFQDASGRLYSVAAPSNHGGRRFEWIVRQADGKTTVALFPWGEADEFPHDAVLYGSMTTDASGRFYVVGSMAHKPVLLQVRP